MKTLIGTGALLAVIATIGIYKSSAQPTPAPVANPTNDDADLAEVQRIVARATACTTTETVDCAAARGVAIGYLADAIRDSDASQTADVIAALDFEDPLIQTTALTWIANNVRGPDLAPQYPRLLRMLSETRYIAVGELACRILETDATYQDVVAHWRAHHVRVSADLHVIETWREMRTADATRLGFTLYPGATAHALADSDRSVGFFTKDSPDKVIAFYAKQPNAKKIAQSDYQNFLMERVQRDTSLGGGAGGAQMSMADIQDLQALQQQFAKTHDRAIAKKIAAKTDAAQHPKPTATGVVVNAMATEPYANHQQPQGDATAIVLQADDRHASKIAFVWSEPALGGTMIELAWSLADAPALAPNTRTEIVEHQP